MPRTTRRRVLDAPVPEVWRTVGDPYHLPRWWPRVARVEQVDHQAFTAVLRTQKGTTVRADYRLIGLEEPEEIAWRQVTEGTPFERFLAAADTRVRLAAEGDGATRVEVRLEQRLRGLARFGGWLMRAATRRQLDEALDALEGLHG